MLTIDKNLIRQIQDFPKEGVVFKDITPLIANKNAFEKICKSFAELSAGADLIAGDGTEGRILCRINRFADAGEPPGLTEGPLVGLKKLDGVAAAAIAVQAEKHGTTVVDERSKTDTVTIRSW
jgi:hypothetical protein